MSQNQYNDKIRRVFAITGACFALFACSWLLQAVVLGPSVLRIAMAVEQGGVAALTLWARSRIK